VLVSHFDQIPPTERCHVAQALLDAWSGRHEGWRSRNFARDEARRLVAKHESMLSRACRENVRVNLPGFPDSARAI
jgi:deoxyhypusine synthase